MTLLQLELLDLGFRAGPGNKMKHQQFQIVFYLDEQEEMAERFIENIGHLEGNLYEYEREMIYLHAWIAAHPVDPDWGR